MSNNHILKVVSGGQTGTDRAALDFAIAKGIAHGGWCPLQRKAEDGVIPAQYKLFETNSDDVRVRTAQNVIDSDGTLVITKDPAIGGTQFTIDEALRLKKPLFHYQISKKQKIDDVVNWIIKNNIKTLNVAGPRASETPVIYQMTYDLLNELLAHPRLQLDLPNHDSSFQPKAKL